MLVSSHSETKTTVLIELPTKEAILLRTILAGVWGCGPLTTFAMPLQTKLETVLPQVSYEEFNEAYTQMVEQKMRTRYGKSAVSD
jgi:hypothetical protein